MHSQHAIREKGATKLPAKFSSNILSFEYAILFDSFPSLKPSSEESKFDMASEWR